MLGQLISGAQTTDFTGTAIEIGGSATAVVTADVSAVSGGSPVLNMWLQGSNDNGATWQDLPYTFQLTTSATAADTSGNANKRNINGTSNCTAAAGYSASYFYALPQHVRIKGIITGSTPSFTISAAVRGA